MENIQTNYTNKEVRTITNRVRTQTYLELLSHIIGNNYMECYECSELIDCYSIEPEELRTITLEVYDDDDTIEWFTHLWEELGLVCDLCEQETDNNKDCMNQDCVACGDDYKPDDDLNNHNIGSSTFDFK